MQPINDDMLHMQIVPIESKYGKVADGQTNKLLILTNIPTFLIVERTNFKEFFYYYNSIYIKIEA